MAFKKTASAGKEAQAPTGFVSYVLPHGAGKGASRPAVVVKTNDDGTVNLTVFTDAGDELPAVWQVQNVKL